MPLRAPSLLERRPAITVAVVLGVVYVATLAPSVTLWDSGEFLAAVHTLGIPHPPGTPLFVFLARAWASLLRPVDFTIAVNLGSAMATAVAVALLARTFARAAGPMTMLAAGLVAGTGSAVWGSATETEVYGYALCLAAVGVAIADHAGRAWSLRHRRLLAFVMGLAVPLHLSALVAGPALVWLAASDDGGTFSFRAAAGPAAAWLVATGIGTVSPGMVLLGAGVGVVGLLLPVGGCGGRGREGLIAVALAAFATTFVLVMIVRARHDPWVNQGHAVTWRALLDVVGRAQYDVPPVWPRRAPAWLQVGNLVQYADWQFALGLDDWPGASLRRTPVTVAFLALGIVGARTHARRDRRTFHALGVLLVSASLGVVGILNLRAGPSFGFGVLPDLALREARERDYFFAMAFAAWGIWAGMGVARLAARRRSAGAAAAIGAVALLPLMANARAMDRRRQPDAVLAPVLGTATLDGTPRDAVLLLGGDNDTYAVWWAQATRSHRRDVTPVTIPLLPADWYRAELARRHGLLDASFVGVWRGTTATLRELGERSRARGRPLAVGVGVGRRDRAVLATGWRFEGLVYVADPSIPGRVELDTEGRRRAEASVRAMGVWNGQRPARDATSRYVQRLLSCPGAGARGEAAALLESTCNY